jgi:hypothetical protein
MEAFQERDVKRDSFEEVDRILTIVEKSKTDYNKAESDLVRRIVVVLFVLVAAIFVVLALLNYIYPSAEKSKFFNIYLPVVSAAIGHLTVEVNFFLKRKKEAQNTTRQAAEVIREIVPTLSYIEHWSALRKFELRLRLSRLGISTDKIFGPEF